MLPKGLTLQKKDVFKVFEDGVERQTKRIVQVKTGSRNECSLSLSSMNPLDGCLQPPGQNNLTLLNLKSQLEGWKNRAAK